jgi:hypothetical protein
MIGNDSQPDKNKKTKGKEGFEIQSKSGRDLQSLIG